jgi:hypothetical protein
MIRGIERVVLKDKLVAGASYNDAVEASRLVRCTVFTKNVPGSGAP